MQAKLLRVLESGEVVRLGSNETRHADVRFVTATNRDLKSLVSSGGFREDLFFRINGSHIQIPPLRERREDIPPLVMFAIDRFATEMAGGPAAAVIPAITDTAMMRLTSYAWPGNVRQLLNVVQNMVVSGLSEERPSGQPLILDTRHIPEDIKSDENGADDLPQSNPTQNGSLAGTSYRSNSKSAPSAKPSASPPATASTPPNFSES